MKNALRIALVIHVWVAAAVIPLLVRFFSLNRILEIFTPSPRSQPYRGFSAGDVAAVVKRRLKHPVLMAGRPCLREGLLMFHFLRLCALESTLHISVLKQEASGRLVAHCWVTCDGGNVSTPPDPMATEVLSHPAASGFKSAASA